MGKLVRTCLGSSYLIAQHVLHCPPPPHAHSFIIGPAAINTHTRAAPVRVRSHRQKTAVTALAPAAVRTLALTLAPPSAPAASLDSFVDFVASVAHLQEPVAAQVLMNQVRGAALPGAAGCSDEYRPTRVVGRQTRSTSQC
jgi:hypothetical protein